MDFAIAEGSVVADRYRLTRPLGSGSSAVVWEALDTSLGRMVAVKLLHGGAADHPAGREQLRREAQALARLSHPRITTVFDYVEQPSGDGRTQPVLVTELLSGQTLEDRLVRGPLTESDARVAAMQLAEALAAAHAAGIIHRDLKPGNVMLVHDGVKLLDFGIAQSASDTDATSGVVVGTPACMAPEQLTGRGALPASDVYALGCVLYWCVTGHAPYEGATVDEVVRGHLQGVPPQLPIRELPPQVAGLYRQCLAKDPTQRPTAATVAVVLAPQAAPARPAAHQTLVMPAYDAPTVTAERPVLEAAAGYPAGAYGRPPQDPGYPAQPTFESAYQAERPRGGKAPSRSVLIVGALAIAALAASITAITMKGTSGGGTPAATGSSSSSSSSSPSDTGSPSGTVSSSSPSDAGSSPGDPSTPLSYLEAMRGQISGFIGQGQDTMDPTVGQDLQNSLSSIESSVQSAQQNGFSSKKVREIQNKIDAVAQRISTASDSGQMSQGASDTLTSELQQLRDAVGGMASNGGNN
jgi:serine/threonine-protein kinase